mmetsp:Transcript_12103/g.32652  ORF Transcript_12103/g.32652 Transcript_12103/m.32652 type:complete len:81 (+) Transcript_12103:39-281(+)
MGRRKKRGHGEKLECWSGEVRQRAELISSIALTFTRIVLVCRSHVTLYYCTYFAGVKGGGVEVESRATLIAHWRGSTLAV